MQRILLVIVSAVFFSCENTERKTENFSAYFDVDSLLDVHQALLIDLPVRVSKRAILEGKNDTTSYAVDSIRVIHEMNIFRKANINKPAFEGLYQKKNYTSGDTSIVEFLPKETDNDLEVKNLKLFSLNNKIHKMEAYVVEDHWLYDSKRHLQILFDPLYSTHTIKSFTVDGTQKMITRDRVNFIVEATIIPNSL